MDTLVLAVHDAAQAAAWHHELQATGDWLVPAPVHSFALARQWLIRQPPALLVADLRLCDGTVIELTRVLRTGLRPASGRPRTQVLALAASDADPLLLDALQAGVDNFFISTGAPTGALAAHVCETLAGGAEIAPWIARRLLDHFGVQWQQSRRVPVEELNNPLALTVAEQGLLRRLSVGEPLAEVARREGVVPHELTARVRAIYRKMQWALRAGSLSLA